MTNADSVLDALDPEQREVAASPLGPMCVLAGAGTGKTRAITHRIAYGVHSGAYQPQRVLAVTFTARAAGEMRTRLRGLGVPAVQARTFHAAALRQLHYFWPQAVGGAAPEVARVKAPLVGEAGNRLRLDLDRPSIRDLASEIEWGKVSMLTPETYPAEARRQGREPAGYDPTVAARLWETYEQVKADRGVMDFEDVLLLTVGMLEDREDVARQVRAQYRHFVVDEYQDVNAVQQRLLRAWLGERRDLCVVGDPAQTIYSFTGASPRHLLDFTREFPEARTVRLIRNYRSTPQVVEVANAVVRAGSRRSGIAPLELVSQGESGQDPRLTVYPDDTAEADGIAAQLHRELAAGRDSHEMAILFRTNAQSEAFESALAARGVPYVVHGGERFFSRPEVRSAILLLRGAARAGTGEESLSRAVGSVLSAEGWSATPPTQGGAVRERWESLQALVHFAEDLERQNAGATLTDLVLELERRAAEQHVPTVGGVTLASLHAAKGLEWDVVFLAGVSDGLLPISMADGPDAVEEERRLLYVGMTRARQRLEISYALARSAGGRTSRKPSRFLAAAERLLGAGAVPEQSASVRVSAGRRAKLPRHCRGCGSELESAAEKKVGRCSQCPPTYDEATFEALRAWRLERASEEKVPAYCVFTDATLTAIAERTPGTLGELAGISGVGQRKLTKYGPDVLRLLGAGSTA